MKHKRFYMIILLLCSLGAALLRYFNLNTAMDELGLFISGHPSTTILVTVSGIVVLLLVGLSHKSPGRGTDHTVLTYGPVAAGLSMAAGLLLLLGAVLDCQTSDIWELMVLILGLLAGISMMVLAKRRQDGNQIPLWELLPIFYLVVDLVFRFKSWSTDPVILDYCFQLTALIFSLLGFYGSAGFCFDLGRPRKTLFYCACGIFFSAVALVDGIYAINLGSMFCNLGRLLWLIPIVLCLLRPNHAASQPAPSEAEGTDQ